MVVFIGADKANDNKIICITRSKKQCAKKLMEYIRDYYDKEEWNCILKKFNCENEKSLIDTVIVRSPSKFDLDIRTFLLDE